LLSSAVGLSNFLEESSVPKPTTRADTSEDLTVKNLHKGKTLNVLCGLSVVPG
jgi:hypothetical protein